MRNLEDSTEVFPFTKGENRGAAATADKDVDYVGETKKAIQKQKILKSKNQAVQEKRAETGEQSSSRNSQEKGNE